MLEPSRVGAVILAAGGSTRFGSPKALALLHGRPLLQHVVDVAAGRGFGDLVVVLGHDATAIRAAIAWPEQASLVLNPDPDAGLSGSLRLGLRSIGPAIDAALVLLGDQPMLDGRVIQALLHAGPSVERPVVVPRYAGGGGSNPVLLARTAWGLAEAATGDRGLGPILRDHPELVLEVPVAGSNPDVDTPAELAALDSAASTRP